jgi:hypothetical protein
MQMQIFMAHWITMLKLLIRSSLDNYVLPGTLTGTEILWLYMIQWKREICTFTFVSIYFLSIQFAFSQAEKVMSDPQNDQEETPQ